MALPAGRASSILKIQNTLRQLLGRALPGSGDFSRWKHRYVANNRLSLLTDGGDIFRRMLQAISSARQTVHLETYIFKDDRVGREFAEILSAKARAGVRVRVIYDSLGSREMDLVFLNRMRNAGVQFLEYHPVAPWRPRWAWNRRDHRKSLIVDSRLAFTGSVNIAEDHVSKKEFGGGWRDIHVELEGPAVLEIERAFRQLWYTETQRWFGLDMRPEVPVGGSLVWVAANHEFLHRYLIRSAYLAAIRAAQRSVVIASAYFIPDRRMTQALAAAARRGVDVRILVPGYSDVRPAWMAGRYQYDYLLRHGVRLFEWPDSVLHAKACAVDKVWATVGSYNLDHRSLRSNLELNLHVLDDGFACGLAEAIEGDLSRSRELRLADWRKRPLLDKIEEAFWRLFRVLL